MVYEGLRIRSPEVPGPLEIGDRVLVANQRQGVLRFIGPTQFAPGIWYGVELDQAVGKNNGSLNGIRYFTCAVGHGIFAPLNRLQKLADRIESASSFHSIDTKKVSTCSDLGSSYHEGPTTRGWTQIPWSSTTSPMVGRAVIGRPSLPNELIEALKAQNISIQPNQSNQFPMFYLTEGLQVLCSGEIGKYNYILSVGTFYIRIKTFMKFVINLVLFCFFIIFILGIIRYIGPISFADGTWVGIELRKPKGRHDGAIGGQRYFSCRSGHGIFVRPSRVFCRGINGINLLPPVLADLERQLASKRQEKLLTGDPPNLETRIS